MADVIIRYRPSGGRGEFEWTPSEALVSKQIRIRVPQYDIELPTEISGKKLSGKPRLRKDEPNNRNKLHIDGIVTALAKLPEPSRVFNPSSIWPLEEKGYVVDSISCDVIASSATDVTLKPTEMTIRGADQLINLTERFTYIASELKERYPKHPELDAAMVAFADELRLEINSRNLRQAVDTVISLQSEIFGPSNAGSAEALAKLESLPASDLEDAPVEPIASQSPVNASPRTPTKGATAPAAPTKTEGKEGRLLTRWHAYRERDRSLVKSAKAAFKAKHGRLFCEACGLDPQTRYGPRGEDRLQAHHRTPIEEMIPGSVTKAKDLAMVCPTCHDIIHAKRPWITVEAVRALLKSYAA